MLTSWQNILKLVRNLSDSDIMHYPSELRKSRNLSHYLNAIAYPENTNHGGSITA